MHLCQIGVVGRVAGTTSALLPELSGLTAFGLVIVQ